MSQERLSERDVRIQKMHDIKKLGIQPYAAKFEKTHAINDLLKLEGQNFRAIDDIILNPVKSFSTAGRVMLYRTHGKLSFAKLLDESGEIQLMFHRDQCKFGSLPRHGETYLSKGDNNIIGLNDKVPLKEGENRPMTEGGAKKSEEGEQLITPYKFIEKYVDVGDFLGVQGELFMTHKGELTLFVSDFTFLAKALRPLGDKFHGVNDIDTIYRQRYLDTILNRESHERFRLRSEFLRVIRQFYRENGFIEVETPVLGNFASGAAAAPFVTHHNEMDIDMYLRISPETALKKMTAGMYEKVFEVAKDFRNEGSDPSHHQEFTMIEHYAAYRDYKKNMDFTEKMFKNIFEKLPQLKKVINVKDKQGVEKEVNFDRNRDRIDYIEQIKIDSGIDVSLYGPEDADRLRADILAKGHHREGVHEQATATMIDYLYKKVTRPKIVGPAFIYNYPKTMQPLARMSDENAGIVEQWQLLINGREIIKAYSELVDPIQQQINFDEQAGAVASGDTEATSGDDDFVLAMEYGMPPQSGRGMGIERIFAMLTEQENIRDVIYAPLMKPIIKDPSVSQELNTSLSKGGLQGVSIGGNPEKGLPENAPLKKGGERGDPEDYGTLPTLSQAKNLIDKYVTETKSHLEEVGKVMAHFARKLGKNENAWHLAGLLHDLDRDHIEKNPEIHCGDQFVVMAKEIGMPDLLIEDIQSHYEDKFQLPMNSLLRKYLVSVDELTGFLGAVRKMMPNKTYEEIKVESVLKKIKDKKFAAGVNREHLKNCEKYLGVELGEFVGEVLEAVKG